VNRAQFHRLCAGLHHLSPRQVSDLEARLSGLGDRMEVLAALDARGEEMRACPRCGADALGRWGVDRRGLRRLRCRACKRTCSATAGSPLAGLRRPEAFRAVLRDMIDADHPASCRRLAARLGVDKTTVWRWRMRILAALERATRALGGVVEADQTTRRESRKGSREWVRHARDPEAHPKPPRPTWRDWRRLGLALPLGHSPWRIPVLALVERAGDRRAGRLKDHNAPSLHAALEPALRQDAVLCSDGDGAFATFARARGVTHYAIPAKHGPRVLPGAFHIQTVNNLHAALKDFLRPFKGPATRYLDGYLTWFIARQRRQDPWIAMIAA
jgi:transposase-like protein